MRSTINHTAPRGLQSCPADNTSAYVSAQVRHWSVTGTLIHTQSAMEIASWWHTPNNAFAPFASTGTIVDDLAWDIGKAIEAANRADATHDRPTDGADALHALNAYVMACTLPELWAVGHNTAGYLPEADVATFIDYADAVTAYVDMIGGAPDALADEPTDGSGICSADGSCVDGGELCDYHSMQAIVGAHTTDDIPSVVNGKVFRAPAELSLSLRPDSAPLPTVYWLSRSAERLTYVDYLAARGL